MKSACSELYDEDEVHDLVLIHFNKHELSLICVLGQFLLSLLEHCDCNGLALLSYYAFFSFHPQISVHNHFDGCLFTNMVFCSSQTYKLEFS